MKKRKEGYILVCAAFALMLLILDSKAALAGAKEGVSLCIFTVLPSLFPFFFFCNLINSRLLGYRMRPLRPICRLCGIPEGAESILVIGLLGGYPIGHSLATLCGRGTAGSLPIPKALCTIRMTKDRGPLLGLSFYLMLSSGGAASSARR